jgi:hypothetical protein
MDTYHKVRQALLKELPDAPAKYFDGILTQLLNGETVTLNWKDQQGKPTCEIYISIFYNCIQVG